MTQDLSIMYIMRLIKEKISYTDAFRIIGVGYNGYKTLIGEK